MPATMTVREVAVDAIDSAPSQPRRAFGNLDELAASITDDGLLEPIMVRPIGARYQIVHGERRWRAARLTGLATVPAIVRELDDAAAFRLAVVENVQRDNLTALEEAHAYQRLVADGMTQAQIGRLVGKSQGRIAQILGLLKLPAPLTAAIGLAGIGEAHVRAVVTLRDIYGPELLRQSTQSPESEDEREAARRLWDYSDDDVAMWLWSTARPEEMCALITFSAATRPIASVLIEYYLSNTALPQWAVAGAYWLALVAGLDMPVATVALAINNWRERYASALLHHRIHPEPPGGPASAKHRLWWGYYGDLRHSGSLSRPQDDFDAVLTLADGAIQRQEFTWPSTYNYALARRSLGQELDTHHRMLLADVEADALWSSISDTDSAMPHDSDRR
jgi:ParB/RepB/Spo0J family partition protein